MNKICHFMSEIRPGGGPMGYLYNIYKDQNEKKFDIKFIKKFDERMNMQKKKNKKYYLKSFLEKSLPYSIIRKFLFKDIFDFKKELFEQRIIDELSCYDVIVFHHIKEFYHWVRKYKPNNQKCYLFSHCPTDFSLEYVSTTGRNDWSQAFKNYCLPFLQKKEVNIFSLADGIICPSKHAVEYYFQDNIACRKKFESLCFTEVISGVVDLQQQDINQNKGEYILYLGRYHTAKGFDLYLEASKLSNCNKKWLCGGFGQLETEIKNYDKVENLGWVTEVNKLIANAAVIVVPNRSTFFDLIILEALSLGKPIVTTLTGGNKALVESSEIILCNSKPSEIAMSVDKIIDINNTGISKVNRDIYEKHYSMEKFIKRYNELTTILVNE